MYIDTFVIILLIASIVGLSLAILFLVRFYSRMIKKVEETEKDKLLLHHNISQKAEEILSQAHQSNLAIITKANQEAAQILSDATKTKVATNEELIQKLSELALVQEQTLKKMSDESLLAYQKTLSDMKNSNLTQIEKLNVELEKQAEENMTNYSNTLQKETVEAENNLKLRVDKEFAQAEAEIEAYKQNEMLKIREQIYPLVQKLSMLVLGKSLTLEDHQKLIEEAISDAQREIAHKSSNYNNNRQNMTTQTPI